MRSYLELVLVGGDKYNKVWKATFIETIDGDQYSFADIYPHDGDPSDQWLDAIEQCAINSFKRFKPWLNSRF